MYVEGRSNRYIGGRRRQEKQTYLLDIEVRSDRHTCWTLKTGATDIHVGSRSQEQQTNMLEVEVRSNRQTCWK